VLKHEDGFVSRCIKARGIWRSFKMANEQLIKFVFAIGEPITLPKTAKVSELLYKMENDRFPGSSTHSQFFANDKNVPSIKKNSTLEEAFLGADVVGAMVVLGKKPPTQIIDDSVDGNNIPPVKKNSSMEEEHPGIGLLHAMLALKKDPPT
jgi:hypothetical protein